MLKKQGPTNKTFSNELLHSDVSVLLDQLRLTYIWSERAQDAV